MPAGSRPADLRRYSGADRRGSGREDVRGARAELFGPALVLLCLAGAVAVEWSGAHISSRSSDRGMAAVSAATAGLALVAGALLVVRGRLAGSTRGAAVGVAVLVLMAAHPALQALEIVMDRRIPGLPEADLGLLVGGLALLVGEQVRPPVDTARRLRSVLAITVVIGGAAAVIALSKAGRSVVPVPSPWLAVTGPGPWPRVALAAALAVLGGAMTGGAVRRRLHLDYWVGLALCLWSGGIAVDLVQPDRSVTPLLVTALRGAGAAALGGALLVQLTGDYVAQRAQLYRTQVSELATIAEQRALRARHRSRAHDARSVILAVQAAGSALQRDLSGLTEQDREALASILHSGLGKLDQYVIGTPDQVFPLSAVGEAARRAASSLHVRLDLSVPDDVMVRGDGTGAEEAVRMVIAHLVEARLADRLVLRAEQDAAAIHIRLESAGSHRSPAERVPTDASLAMVAAAELVRRHGGRFEPYRTAGGWGFALSWPLAPDEGEEARQSG